MKYSLNVNQAGVVQHGLLESLAVAEVCLLDYLDDWPRCRGARRLTVDGKEFVWVNGSHAVAELPMLFRPTATLRSRRNQLSKMLNKLRQAAMIESTRSGGDLYLRITDLGRSVLTLQGASGSPRAKRLPKRDDGVTPARDGSITSTQDSEGSHYIEETDTKEKTSTSETQQVHSRRSLDSAETDSLEAQALRILGIYPKQIGRVAALSAIKGAIQEHGFDRILDLTKQYAATYQGDLKYMPNPRTFFGEQRFLDSPSTWFYRSPASSSKVMPPRQFDPSDYQQPNTNL